MSVFELDDDEFDVSHGDLVERRKAANRPKVDIWPRDKIADLREIKHLRELGMSDHKIMDRLGLNHTMFATRLDLGGLRKCIPMTDRALRAALDRLIASGGKFHAGMLPQGASESATLDAITSARMSKRIVRVGTAKGDDGSATALWQSSAVAEP